MLSYWCIGILLVWVYRAGLQCCPTGVLGWYGYIEQHCSVVILVYWYTLAMGIEMFCCNGPYAKFLK